MTRCFSFLFFIHHFEEPFLSSPQGNNYVNGNGRIERQREGRIGREIEIEEFF